ncbi:hypothetical protein CC79DRAFT_1326483 [Sarocladium strictum]
MPGVQEPAPDHYGLMFYLHIIKEEPGDDRGGVVDHDDFKVRYSGLSTNAQLGPRQFHSPAYPPGSFESQVFDLVTEGSETKFKGSIRSQWCVLVEHENFALVLADKDSKWGGGATGPSTIKGQQLRKVILKAAGTTLT